MYGRRKYKHLRIIRKGEKMKLDIFQIQKRMIAFGFTQGKLGERAGISRQSVNTILTRGTCSVLNAGRLAEALNCELEDIVVIERG